MSISTSMNMSMGLQQQQHHQHNWNELPGEALSEVFSVLATDPYPHHGSAIHASGNGVTAVFDEDSVIPDLDND